jgi:hypothetical protein
MKFYFTIILLVSFIAVSLVNAEVSTEDELVEWLLEQSRDVEDYSPSWKTHLGLRLRQEYLQNVFHFNPGNDSRNWLRLRMRAGLQWNYGSHRVDFRLANEFRDIYEPNAKWIELDELIVDRAAWTWGTRQRDPYTLIVGRQDIIWDDGFLMLEGHPLDGSRSIYHNAVRLQLHDRRGDWEMLGIIGPQKDPIILSGNRDRALSEHDEFATALRYQSHAGSAVSLIWKKETLVETPYWEWCTITLGFRQPWKHFMMEGAIQRHSSAEWAYALQLEGSAQLLRGTRAELGYFHYSGAGEKSTGFKSPYGRWPIWSELYIYTLIGEGGVASWQNIASLHGQLHQDLGNAASLRLSVHWMGAPEPEWLSRGLLLQSQLTLDLADTLSMHFLWEYLDPGSFHADAKENAHFLRWEINYELN